MEYKCFQCGHDLIVQDTWEASDIGLVDEDKAETEHDYEVYMTDCPYCGVRYEVAKCPLSEQHNYKYYQEQ